MGLERLLALLAWVALLTAVMHLVVKREVFLAFVQGLYS